MIRSRTNQTAGETDNRLFPCTAQMRHDTLEAWRGSSLLICFVSLTAYGWPFFASPKSLEPAQLRSLIYPRPSAPQTDTSPRIQRLLSHLLPLHISPTLHSPKSALASQPIPAFPTSFPRHFYPQTRKYNMAACTSKSPSTSGENCRLAPCALWGTRRCGTKTGIAMRSFGDIPLWQDFQV